MSKSHSSAPHPSSGSDASCAIGGGRFLVVAGPCAVENDASLRYIAESVAAAGAHALRGGAFKPRTLPTSFQGLGTLGLEMLADAGQATSLPVVTEVLDVRHVAQVAQFASVLQIGARSMQNVALLREAALTGLPILLKRHFGATIEEFIGASQYIRDAGNNSIIMCERGIRTFEPSTRFTLDIAAIPLIQERTGLPVIVDPSHAAGTSHLVQPLALAAIAAGADGIMIEVHQDPAHALSDGAQSLSVEQFAALAPQVLELSENPRCNGLRAQTQHVEIPPVQPARPLQIVGEAR